MPQIPIARNMDSWLEDAWLDRYLNGALTDDETTWFEAYVLNKPELLSRIDADTSLRNALTAARIDVGPSERGGRMEAGAQSSEKIGSRIWLAMAAGIVLAICGGLTWQLFVKDQRLQTVEQEASQAKASVEHVSDVFANFLTSLTLQDPKDNALVIRLLNAATGLGRNQLDSQPRAQAKLFMALGYAYKSLGQRIEAIECFRKASQLFLDARIDDPLSAASALSQLAVMYANESYRLAEAENLARKALSLRESHQGGPLDLADSYNSLGVVLVRQQRLAEAEDALLKGLSLRRQYAAKPVDVASSLQNLALLGSPSGKPDVALKYFEEALSIEVNQLGQHDVDISYQHISQNYGVALAAANHPDAAAKVLLKSLSLSEELFGADSAPTGDAHNELASALQDLGRFREALPHYQEAIRINRLASSEESADRARAINNLASLYEDMGDYVLAVPLLRESLEIREHLLPEDDMMILVARYNLGRVLAKARDLEHARTLLDSVRLTALERFGQSHEITVKADLWLAIVDVRLGDTAAAAVALEKLDTSTAPFSPYMLAMRSTLRAELAFARHDEATLLESRKTAWEDMKKGLGERHPLTAEFGITYAAALADAGRLRAAREIAKPLVPIINDAFVSTSDVRRIAARWDT